MPTVRETLQQPLGQIIPIGHDAPGTTSIKAAATPYDPITSYNFVPEAALGSPGILGPEKQDDVLRLAQNGEYATDVRHIIGNEGDTRRLWARMTVPIEKAFSISPYVEHRWEVGPIGPTDTAATVDVRFGFGNSFALVGEFKRPGIIDPESWRNATTTTNKTRIGKELRMYAHKYKCPQTFCFDGVNLLIVRFRALSADAIREANCVIDCCVVNVSNGNPMYWLYRLVAEGINRIQGQSAEQLGLQGLNRYFQYFDGKPYWRAPAGNTFWEPPSGAVRRFLPSGNWAWDVNGTHYRDTPGYEDL